MADKAKILVICGPTATGKTALSVEVAKRLNGEIICADSMQIYKELSIGTAKVTESEKCGVPHFIVDFLPPSQQFSVADYTKLARHCIEDITSRGKLPIIVGGTGQYIEGVTKGIRFTGEKVSGEIRQKLQNRLEEEGIEKLYKELCEIDPEYVKNLHINNKVRVLRALELYMQTGKTMTWQLQNSLPVVRPYNDVTVALTYEPRALLYDKINTRVDDMIQRGLLKEAQFVYENREDYITAAQAIGYKELFAYIENAATLSECTEKLKQATRNYAKRQLTWFKRMEGIKWLDVARDNLADRVQQLVDIFEQSN